LPFGRLHDISLKWKLLIPFLFLALVGATALFVVSVHFQTRLIHDNEEKRLRNQYHFFLDELDAKTNMAMSLAYLVARNPDVAEAFAERDRARLMELLQPAYESLHDNFGVRQFHFHIPPATSFLRLHALDQHGEAMASYRSTINEAQETGTAVGGLEWGVSGFGIRSVVPVFHRGLQAGTVEVGLSFEEPLLKEFKERFGTDLTLYLPPDPEDEGLRILASTLGKAMLPPELFDEAYKAGKIVLHSGRLDGRDMAVIAGPVRDFSSKIVAVIEISADRSPTIALLKRYGTIASVIGLAGLALSISFVWLISVVFTRRIEQVVQAADEIAAGHRDTRISVRSADELGVMARAINEMLTSLEKSRRQINDYAENLEHMVEQRTHLLKESENTYRTLVEHVPLIVYLVMADGSTTYLNRFVEQTLGATPLELSGHHELWTEFIHPNDRARAIQDFDVCLSAGKEFLAEYRMMTKEGDIVYVMDHAVPVFDNGIFIRMDGIVVDVTARRELEQKILQADELQTLSDVSARLAHEIRNPLTSVGGLTRRLLKSFDTTDSRRKKAELIVSEVERLERILKMMTAYVEPKAIHLSPCNLHAMVRKAVQTVTSKYTAEGFSVKLMEVSSIPETKLDCDLMEKVLVNLMENAYFRMKERGDIEIALDKRDEYAKVSLAYKVPYISDDDIEHFFYPFIAEYPFPEGKSDAAIIDVPMARVIIHKHGGIIEVKKDDSHLVNITISLPLA
jgi:PAS domain S-box-containing protein